MRQSPSAACHLARVAGDTFGVLGADGDLGPEHLRDIFRRPFLIDGVEHGISATIGLLRLARGGR